MLRVVFILLVGCISLQGWAQCSFHRVYDYQQYNDNFNGVVASKNGTFATCGYTTNGSYAPLRIINSTVCGDTIFVRNVNFSSGGDGGKSIIQTYDGGYSICGALYDSIEGAANGYLYLIDETGDSLWFGEYNIGFNDYFQEHLQTPDSGFVIAGFRNVFEDSSMFIVKTDKLGNMEWVQYYGGTGWDKPFDIQLTTDGGYVMSGERGNAATSSMDIFLLKTDSLGNEEWYQYYNSQATADDGHGHVILSNDGGYIISGTKERSDGNQDWTGWVRAIGS